MKSYAPLCLLLTFILLLLAPALTRNAQASGVGARPAGAAAARVFRPANQARQQRNVTVRLKNGSEVRGVFLSATADTLTIEVQGTRRHINLDTVASVEFAPGAPASTPIRDAMQALRRVAEGAVLGTVTLEQYRTLVGNADTAMTAAQASLSAGELKTEMEAAHQAYKDALRAWEWVAQREQQLEQRNPPMYLTPNSLALELRQKYNVPEKRHQLSTVPHLERDDVLRTVWGAARAHIDRAAARLPN